MIRTHFSILCVLLVASTATPVTAQDEARTRKQANAVRVPGGSVRVDGRLDEEIWLKAPVVSDFVQKEPVEGAAPTDVMEVRFVYDESALYVGARMATAAHTSVQAPLGRRDASAQAENVQLWFDTFLDRRTAVMFGVTASGVRLDEFHPTDNEDDSDAGFDPVWQARTAVGPNGWTAE